MSTEQQHFSKLEEILSKIPNGKERYKTSPLVSYYVNSLLHGADPIELMGGLLNILEQTSSQLIELRMKQPLQPITMDFDPEDDVHKGWLQKVINESSMIVRPESTGGPIVAQNIV